MPTSDDVVLASRDAVQAELRLSRPNASPWIDAKLGLDDGAGYNFSKRTLRPSVKEVYARMEANPALAPVAHKFALPARLPVSELLEETVSNLERFVASDVCKQLGL